jgi:hypothetical protein
VLADRGLGFVGQQQAAQPAVRIGERGGDGVVPIQPDGAFRSVRRGAWGVGLTVTSMRRSGALGRRGEALGWSFPGRTRLKLTARCAAMRGRLASGSRTITVGAITAGTIGEGAIAAGSVRACAAGVRAVVPRFSVVAINCVAGLAAAAATGVRTLSAAALSGRSRRMSPRPAIGTTVGGRARGAAGTVAMRRFHYQPPITSSREPAQTARMRAPPIFRPSHVPIVVLALPRVRAARPLRPLAGRPRAGSISA